MTRVIQNVLAAVALSACATIEDRPLPQTELPSQWSTIWPEIMAAPGVEGAGVSPEIGVLIDQALSGNFDVEVAELRFQQALALQSAEEARLWPSLSFEAGTQFDGTFDGTGSNSGSLALVGVFDPDLNGRQSASIDRARARAGSLLASAQDAKRLTALAIAEEYVIYQRAVLQMELLEHSIELQSRLSEIIEARQSAGIVASVDLTRAKADLAATEAQLSGTLLNRRVSRIRLASLTGQPSLELAPEELEDGQLEALVGWTDTGVPSDLIRARPDVRARAQDYIAAVSTADIERSSLYPALTIPGQISLNPGDLSNIAGSAGLSLGANLVSQVFDGGARKAQIEASDIAVQIAETELRSTLLSAFHDVETALVTISQRRDQLSELRAAERASQNAYEQINANYEAGLVDFSDVILAQRTFIENSQSAVDIAAELARAKLALHAALGGAMLVPSSDAASN